MTSELVPRPPVVFAHESEAEIARLLDFYGVHWKYEPRSFPLEWDVEGRPTQSFTPDFYLPANDLYIEVASTDRARADARSVRLLRQNYPSVHIELHWPPDSTLNVL